MFRATVCWDARGIETYWTIDRCCLLWIDCIFRDRHWDAVTNKFFEPLDMSSEVIAERCIVKEMSGDWYHECAFIAETFPYFDLIGVGYFGFEHERDEWSDFLVTGYYIRISWRSHTILVKPLRILHRESDFTEYDETKFILSGPSEHLPEILREIYAFQKLSGQVGQKSRFVEPDLEEFCKPQNTCHQLLDPCAGEVSTARRI